MIEDANNPKRTVFNVCYINQRNKRRIHPRFLRRNLRHILDSHQKQLRSKPDACRDQEMIANEKRHWGWDFPTTGMLEDYMSGRKPVLQLESLQLRKTNPKSGTTQKATREPASDSEGPDWLPDSQTGPIWSCAVSIAIYIPRDAQNSKKQIHYESLPAAIIQHHPHDDEPYFDIKLDKPFFFQVDKLFVVTDSGVKLNGGRYWKRTATASYLLEISIQCQDSDDSADFLAALEGKTAAAYQDSPSNEAVLRASWDRLPCCPSDKDLLTLRRAKAHKSLELDYKLSLALGWINRREYSLKTYNALYTLKQEGLAHTTTPPATTTMTTTATSMRQLPTPSASDDMEKPAKRHNIVWTFNDGGVTRSMPVKALTCALCQDAREYACLAYLMLHCKRDHDHFNFDVVEANKEKPDAVAVHATISMSAAPLQYEKVATDSSKDMNWVAPDRPFNLAAYLRGQDDWTGSGRAKSKKGLARSLKDRDLPSASATAASRKRPALEEIEDLPRQTPKKHRVPNVPGVTFYRKMSKQPLEPGTFVAESDDDVDETWLAQNQGRALEGLGVTAAAKDFTTAFNEHLAREQSDSSLLTRDAVVRFARLHQLELRDVQWQALFTAKLQQLRRVGIIADDVVAHCMRLARRSQSPPGQSSAASAGAERDLSNGDTTATGNVTVPHKHVNGASVKYVSGGINLLNEDRSVTPEVALSTHRERKKWAGGKTVLRDNNSNSAMASSKTLDCAGQSSNGRLGEQVSGRCSCGKAATEARGTIACADPQCKRKDFHLACAGLKQRPPNWLCFDCDIKATLREIRELGSRNA